MSLMVDKPIRLQPREPATPRRLDVLRSPKRIRATLGGETVVYSRDVLVLRGNHVLPVYFFPRAAVRDGALEPSGRRSLEEPGGEAIRFTVSAGSRHVEDAAWSFPEPADAALAPLRDRVAFRWSAMDQWFEEDEEVFVHARDPYTRIDALRSSSRVEVVFDGAIIADTTRAVLLFETHLPTRFYIPHDDIRMDRLVPSATLTRCPYKGEASYWSARRQDGTLVPDIAWEYREPVPELPKIKGLIAFYPDAVDAIRLDGQPAG